ncbi:MAG: hypothetical protein WD076_10015 [Parvularculaceae bacterium]
MRPLATLLIAIALSSPAAAETTVDIKEWQVPWADSRPRDPYAESATSVWFVGQRSGYLAHLNVATGAMTKVDLPAGEGPHNLIVGEDGIVWYAGNLTGVIGRYDPKTEELTSIPMPDAAARDPHTLVFHENEEFIFFTLQGANMMGRLEVETGEVTLISSLTERSRPYGIKVAPDGSVWVVLFGTNKLAQIDPESMEHREIDLPRADARPRRLEIGADGRVWYVDYAKGRLGVFDPQKNKFEEWMLPSGEGSRPYGTALDSSGRIWLVETGVQPNMFVGFDPRTKKYFGATPIHSGGGTVRHMHYHEPSGAVWFGTDTNYIGRAIVEPAKADAN